MMETCLSCDIVMPLDELQDHVDFCKELMYVVKINPGVYYWNELDIKQCMYFFNQQ